MQDSCTCLSSAVTGVARILQMRKCACAVHSCARGAYLFAHAGQCRRSGHAIQGPFEDAFAK